MDCMSNLQNCAVLLVRDKSLNAVKDIPLFMQLIRREPARSDISKSDGKSDQHWNCKRPEIVYIKDWTIQADASSSGSVVSNLIWPRRFPAR